MILEFNVIVSWKGLLRKAKTFEGKCLYDAVIFMKILLKNLY